MDWSSVTFSELADALKESEWSSPPRPLSDFFSRFSAPTGFSSWASRFKCNSYVYRTNYVILMSLFLQVGSIFLRSMASFFGAILAIIALACLNDSFALSVSEKIVRSVRRVYPPFAAKLRAPLTTSGRSRPLKGAVYICGKDRRLIFAGLLSVSMLILVLSSAFKVSIISLSIGLLLIFLHASFRTPNLKARLNTFREEFRAVWRSYSDF